MLALLFSSVGKWILAGAGIAVVGGVIWWKYTSMQNDITELGQRAQAAEASASVYKASNDELATTVSDLQAQIKINDDAAQQAQAAGQQLSLNLTWAKKEVDHAKPTEAACTALSDRDSAALAGLHSIFLEPAASAGGGSEGGEGAPTPGAHAGNGSASGGQDHHP